MAFKPCTDDYYYPQEEMQKKVKLSTETYEYEMPFKYENIKVTRYGMRGREGHGVEMNMINHYYEDGCPDAKPLPADTPPGFVTLECTPVEEWYNDFEYRPAMPVRFRINNLWGMHLRVDTLMADTKDVKRKFEFEGKDQYEPLPDRHAELYKSMEGKLNTMKSDYHENPLAGMSCAIFEIPPSKKVVIQGGSEIPVWNSDIFPGDHHYSFRTIRTTVETKREVV
ncbi:MAG: hypothetical protein ACYTFY_20700 [Planctomycetota bacterium]|jgi:hypothetical protein